MPKYKTGEDYYHKIYLLFNGLVAVSLVPFGYLVLEKTQGQSQNMITNDYASWLVTSLLLIIGGILLHTSSKKFREELKLAILKDNLRFKLDAYYLVSRQKILFFTLAALIFDTGLFLTSNTLFIVGFVVSMVLLSLGRPTLKLIIDELRLNNEEQMILSEKKEIG